MSKLTNMLVYHFKLLKFVGSHRNASVFVIGLIHPELLVGILEGSLLRALARQYSLTVHNILPHDKHTVWMKYLYWLIYRLPHVLLVHTAETAEALVKQFGVNANKIVVVAHGSNDAVELSVLSPTQAKQSLGFAPTDRVLLFFGGVAPYKGLDLLLDAVQERSDVKLLVAGRCPNSKYGRAIRSRLNALVHDQQAVWLDGYLDEAGISDIFAASDGVVLPYKHIDQSGVLLLALTLGTPLITTNVGSFGTFITPATGVMVDEPSSSALSRGIAEFYAALPTIKPEKIRAIGEAMAWKNTVKPLVPLL